MKISIISPVYGAEKIVKKLVLEIQNCIQPLRVEYEIILVEDGSPDDSWARIEEVCASNPKVKGVRLSRNFGQHYAISAGLEMSDSDYAIVMDCDLQDNPEYIPEMVRQAEKGFDIVYTVKEQRAHNWFKNITAKVFNSIFNFLIDNSSYKAHKNIGSYSLVNRKVVEAYLQVKDSRRHYLMILRWLGFKSTFIEIEHRERFEGRSSYDFRRLLNHAIDGITSQSDKLLRLSIYVGMLMSAVAFIAGLYVVIRSFIDPFQSGWASVIVLILFVGGITIISIGISGIYIGRTFEQSKGRPLYLIDKKLNF